MRRRELLLVLGGALTAAPKLRAQQKAMPVIGFLGNASPGPFAPFVAAFHQGLSETGYVEGQNLATEYRWAEGRYDLLPALAADLVGRKVDLIATSADASALAAKNATSTIPIVFVNGSDPVEIGLVVSFARPGGNLTGVSIMTGELIDGRADAQAVRAAVRVGSPGPRDRPVGEPEQCGGRAHDQRRAGGVPRKGGAAPSPEGRHRKRHRRRLREPRPTASQCAPRRQRSVPFQPARAARGADITPCRSGDL